MSITRRLPLTFSLAAVLAGAASPAPAQAPPPPRFLTVPEMSRAMETSATRYGFGSTQQLVAMGPSQFAKRFWPEMQGVPETLKVVEEGGKRRLEEARCTPEAEALVESADDARFRKESERALEIYMQAASADATCSVALSGAAEAQLALGRGAAAVDLHRRAVAFSPYDHRLRYFLASALLAQDRHAEALDELVEALVLRPRFPFALATLQARAAALGVEVHAEEFRPEAFAYANGPRVEIAVPAGEPAEVPWTAWATCKAFWIGEEAHRKTATGAAKHGFTTTEELECLAALVASYQQERAAGRMPADPALDRLERIAMDGFASEMVAYEMGTRVVPWATLMLDDAQRARMREYVRRYVVVKKPAP